MATVTAEQLCALALAAIDDADARVVLADAIEESGWWVPRPERTVRVERYEGYNLHADNQPHLTTLDRLLSETGNFGSCLTLPKVDHEGALAIAAVLLFGDWPTSWPLAERCRRRPSTYREMIDDARRVIRTGHNVENYAMHQYVVEHAYRISRK